MTIAADKARALLDIALKTYREEVQPALPAGQRYSGAMIANALGVAERQLVNADPSTTLAEALGQETPEALATAIRSGAVSDDSHQDLAQTLLTHVRAELTISNPRFLARREG